MGSKKGKPGAITKTSYSAAVDLKRRISFDPRPTSVKETPVNTIEIVNKFRDKLLLSNKESLWLLSMRYKYEDYEETSEDLKLIGKQCSLYFRFLNEEVVFSSHPHEVSRTCGQSASQFWRSHRCTRVTASESKRILGLSRGSSRMKFLQIHMWGLNAVQTWAMRYGQLNERNARRDYLIEMKKEDMDAHLLEVGIMINTDFPGLSCSPDGLLLTNAKNIEDNQLTHPIVLQSHDGDSLYSALTCSSDGHTLIHNGEIRLIEIKCPLTLEKVDPNNFLEHLSHSQLQRFILKKDGEDIVVRTNHKWFYQIQMSLDILELTWCDLVIWSPKGMMIIPIKYDRVFWEAKRDALIKIHRQLFVPELFTMRAPRGLHPIILQYDQWHEDHQETYFYDITLPESNNQSKEENSDANTSVEDDSNDILIEADSSDDISLSEFI